MNGGAHTKHEEPLSSVFAVQVQTSRVAIRRTGNHIRILTASTRLAIEAVTYMISPVVEICGWKSFKNQSYSSLSHYLLLHSAGRISSEAKRDTHDQRLPQSDFRNQYSTTDAHEGHEDVAGRGGRVGVPGCGETTGTEGVESVVHPG